MASPRQAGLGPMPSVDPDTVAASVDPDTAAAVVDPGTVVAPVALQQLEAALLWKRC